jgi:hypothetical protein
MSAAAAAVAAVATDRPDPRCSRDDVDEDPDVILDDVDDDADTDEAGPNSGTAGESLAISSFFFFFVLLGFLSILF